MLNSATPATTSVQTHDQNRPSWWQVLKNAASGWQQHKATQLAAAIAYQTIFSIAPLVLIVTAITAAVLGEKAVHGYLSEEIEQFVGADGAKTIEDMVVRARKPGAGITATVTGIVFVLIGAVSLVIQLKQALNSVWNVAPSASAGTWATVREYLISLSMVLALGFVLLVSLVISALLTAMGTWFSGMLPVPQLAAHSINAAVTWVLIGFLFTMILEFIPDAKVPRRAAVVGGLVTAILFLIGKFLFGLYLGHATLGSTYGAAGAVVVILIWAYYSSLILIFGAELTRAYSERLGQPRARKPDRPPEQPA